MGKQPKQTGAAVRQGNSQKTRLAAATVFRGSRVFLVVSVVLPFCRQRFCFWLLSVRFRNRLAMCNCGKEGRPTGRTAALVRLTRKTCVADYGLIGRCRQATAILGLCCSQTQQQAKTCSWLAAVEWDRALHRPVIDTIISRKYCTCIFEGFLRWNLNCYPQTGRIIVGSLAYAAYRLCRSIPANVGR